MKIEFKQVDKQRIHIYGIKGKQKKMIGHIFTPSGSGNDTLNAIQVCGFEEAYNLWGCGIFGEKNVRKIHYTKKQLKRIDKLAKTSKDKWSKKHFTKELKKGYREENNTVMKKDIQLMFKMYDGIEETWRGSNCWGCYNHPCTCDNKRGKKPYKLKTHKSLEKELQKKKERLNKLKIIKLKK